MPDLYIRIFKVDRLRIGDNWNLDGIRDPYWRLYRNDSDGASLLFEGRRVRLRANRVHLIPRNVAFACRNVRQLTHFYVHFDVHGMPRRIQEEFFREPIVLPSAGALEQRIAALAATLPWDPPADLVQRGRLQSCVLEAISARLDDVPAERLAATWRTAEAALPIQPALEHIWQGLGGKLTNARLASLCHMSEDHFIRTFRAHVGRTPNRYVVERRLDVAAQLLRFTELPIEEIAEQTGLGNRAYLTRRFTMLMGMSPARYRRASRV